MTHKTDGAAIVLILLFALLTLVPMASGEGRHSGVVGGGGVEIRLGPVGFANSGDAVGFHDQHRSNQGSFATGRGHRSFSRESGRGDHQNGRHDGRPFLNRGVGPWGFSYGLNPSILGGKSFPLGTRSRHVAPLPHRTFRAYYPSLIYVPVPVRGESDPVAYRGEGRGATVHQPGQDHDNGGGEESGESIAPRGIVDPGVVRVLQENALGEPSTWVDSRSGDEITVTPTRDIKGDEYCREFRHTVSTTSGQIAASGVACLTSEGKWGHVL